MIWHIPAVVGGMLLSGSALDTLFEPKEMTLEDLYCSEYLACGREPLHGEGGEGGGGDAGGDSGGGGSGGGDAGGGDSGGGDSGGGDAGGDCGG